MAIGDVFARPLRALHLDNIRNKILALSVLATLIPTLATTVISYGRNRRALSEKIDQELRGTSSEAARALDQWLDERLDELHVSASSYVLSDNVGRQSSGADRAVDRLRDYLASARERFPAFETLLIIDARRPEELIASADAAMYKAKSQGRNRVIAASGGIPQEPAPERKPRRRTGES